MHFFKRMATWVLWLVGSVMMMGILLVNLIVIIIIFRLVHVLPSKWLDHLSLCFYCKKSDMAVFGCHHCLFFFFQGN